MNLVSAALLLSSAVSIGGAPIDGMLKKLKVPSTGQEWVSFAPGVEVQEVDFSSETPQTAARMKNTLNRMLSGTSERQGDYNTLFLDGSQTYYDEYAQAWRLLGMYIDCDAVSNDDNQDDKYETGCARYLLWAAYIDEDYAGGGIGEYMFYNRHSKKWDETSCTAADGRCAPMDCHLPSTNFKLLAYFKEPKYADEWMEQLFKHEGICVWTDEEYLFMQDERTVWPEKCTPLNGDSNNGYNGLYYDVKPLSGGRMTLGLYTESTCTQEYTGRENVLHILKTYVETYGDDDGNDDDENPYNGNIYELEEYIEKWNEAFDIFKLCQPCRAYNLGWNTDLTYGEDREGGNADEADDDGNEGVFTCKDDAGYTNVNQCMKFATHTTMMVANARDMKLAAHQGTILETTLNGRVYGDNSVLAKQFGTTPSKELKAFFFTSLSFLVFGCVAFIWAWTTLKKDEGSKVIPLME